MRSQLHLRATHPLDPKSDRWIIQIYVLFTAVRLFSKPSIFGSDDDSFVLSTFSCGYPPVELLFIFRSYNH